MIFLIFAVLWLSGAFFDAGISKETCLIISQVFVVGSILNGRIKEANR